MARDTWYRLDNVGKFYSAQAGSPFQTVFRFSATLVDEVDEQILQHALDKTVHVFPSFNVHLRSGMFWHYLEPAAVPPTVSPENLPICFGLHVDAKSVLVRVSYYHHRINLELSHMVSDGRGTMNFFKALLSAYVEERYGIEGIPLEYDEGDDHQRPEDSFNKYYERDKMTSLPVEPDTLTSGRKPKIYRLTGWRDAAVPTYMEYHLPAQSVRNLARSYGVSVTSLVIAAIICAIHAEMPPRDLHRTIRVEIPVDLRQIFESKTINNFFGMTSVSYTCKEDESVEQVAEQIHAQLKEAAQAHRLKPRMNRMIALEKSPFLRFAPLFLKDIVLGWVSLLAAHRTTTTVSNLGQTHLDESHSPYFKDMNVLTSTTGTNFTLCSLEDDLSIGISTIYHNLNVVKHLCRYFSAEGIKGLININKTNEEVAADWRGIQLETSLKRLGGQLPTHDDDALSPTHNTIQTESQSPYTLQAGSHLPNTLQAQPQAHNTKQTGSEGELVALTGTVLPTPTIPDQKLSFGFGKGRLNREAL